MTQHIPIGKFKQKAFRYIERGITQDVERSRGQLFTSMRYRWTAQPEINCPTCGTKTPHNVFTTERSIPKGIIAGDRGTFEVQVQHGKVHSIYLVA